VGFDVARVEVARFLVGVLVVGDVDVTDLVVDSVAAGFEVAGSVLAGFEVAGSVLADFGVAGLLDSGFEVVGFDVDRFRAVRLAGGSTPSAAGWGAGAADSGTIP
jgi:hypothetical protein